MHKLKIYSLTNNKSNLYILSTCLNTHLTREHWTVLFHDVQHNFLLQIYLGKTTPTVINSTGPRLVILFKAGSKPGSGFKANYYFETGIRDIYWSYFGWAYLLPRTLVLPAPSHSVLSIKYKYGSENFYIFFTHHWKL